MKKLVVVSLGEETGKEISQQLRNLIGEHVIIENILMSKTADSKVEPDLVLFTSEFIAKSALEHFKEGTPYLIAERVINHRNIERVISLPPGTEVLLLNDSQNTAFEAIEQLTQIGLDHIKYFPYYPGCEDYPNLEIAITPGEVWLSPEDVKTLINIGTRILDIKTIHEVLSKLDMEGVLQESLVTEYIRDIVEISRSIDENRKAAIKSEKLLETILNNMESGISYVDNLGKVISVNSKFEAIFGREKKDLLMKGLSEVIDSFDILSDKSKTAIREVDGREIFVDVDKADFEHKSGYLVTVNYTDEISKLDHEIKRNYEKRNRRKYYTFEDYLTVNKDVKEMLKRAEKFSKTDGTILIQGENGTGKEILAQAVHMSSYRRKNIFVPINIAAIAPSLLESELFGYEEGAFTGARKGGKVGLFEIADGGTIFIDEVGDAPLDFQVKLLRALEEKRIRRVGAAEEIPIDVRVIAATNKNLLKLIDEGGFREDLFFRLNILPLKTIPLRNRRDDVKYLLKYFADISFGKHKLQSIDDLFDREVLEFLENYKWRGNVRELINLVEYLSFIYEGKKLGLVSLHHYMLESEGFGEKVILDRYELWVLEQISSNGGAGIGRSALTQLAKLQGNNLGEGKIRAILKRLEDMELIEHGVNKRGCVISRQGQNVLENYK